MIGVTAVCVCVCVYVCVCVSGVCVCLCLCVCVCVRELYSDERDLAQVPATATFPPRTRARLGLTGPARRSQPVCQAAALQWQRLGRNVPAHQVRGQV